MLFAAAIIWGTSFFVMKNALDVIPVFYLLAIRFTAGAVPAGGGLLEEVGGLYPGLSMAWGGDRGFPVPGLFGPDFWTGPDHTLPKMHF